MKPILLVLFLFGWINMVVCQTGRLTGTVLDAETKTPLEFATINILRTDSTPLSYQLSDKNGRFSFELLPVKKKLLVSVSYTGYTDHRSGFELEPGKTDTLHILLTPNLKDTNGVVVTAAVPVRMNGDTLEINPAAFKMNPDAVVEELLNQVAGITIWSDGTITVNGRKVQNLMVDGKPFLGSTDPRVATQNLPKAAIDKIQVYQEYDRKNINSQQRRPQDSTLTMNIKLKESSKKGYFGKVGAGYGSTSRFESDLSFQVYNKQSSAGIGGGFNNINKNIGNLRDMFQNNTYRNFNPNLYNVGRFGASGINRNHTLGGVFTHSFIKQANGRQNNHVTVNYNKSGTATYITDLNLQNRTTIANPQFIRDEGEENSLNHQHDLGINYVKTNSYNDNLSLNGNVNTNNERENSSRYTEVRDSINLLQSTNRSNTRLQRRTDNESLGLEFSKSDYENPLKSYTLQLDGKRENTIAERDVISTFESLVDASKNTTYNRHYNTRNNSLNISGSLDYAGFKRLLLRRYNLFGIQLNLTQWFNYLREQDDNHVTDFNNTDRKYVTNDSLTYRNKRDLFEYTPSLTLSKNFSSWSDLYYRNLNFRIKLMEDFKNDRNSSTIVQRNLDRSFQFFRYEGSVDYQYSKQQQYRYYMSMGYTKRFEYPAIEQLYTIVDDINVYNTRVGNPFLRNKINHSVYMNGSFNTQKPQAVYTFNGNIGGNYNRALHPVVDSTVNEPSGRRISYYINGDQSSNLGLNCNFNLARKLKKNSIQFRYNGRLSNNSFPNYVDGVYNISKTSGLYHDFSLQFSVRTVLILNLNRILQDYSSRQTAAGLNAFKNKNKTARFGAVVNYPAHFSFSTTLDHIDNSNLNKPTILWNTFATYRFMQQQAEFKVSAMDILRQYRNISNSVNAYGTTTRITNGLQQFFLLTFSYYPRKFGKTEIKRQSKEFVY